MAFNLTRMTAYTLISAIESDFRLLVKQNINNITITDKLEKKAKHRIEKDIGVIFGDIVNEELVDYFDIGDSVEVINANRKHFPKHVSELIKNITPNMQKIFSIRNRIMHIRPLDYDDLPIIKSFCDDLINRDNTLWENIKTTQTKLRRDPSFALSLDIENLDNEKVVNNNLPFPDFDETGLIGRNQEVKKIKELCLASNFPIISIVGEGGIGKSALALKVAYELVDDNNSPFDAVVWVSSKTTQITVSEIKDIKGAINTSLGVIQEISDRVVGGSDTSSNLEEVTEYLTTFKVALFIDNLETILDENIKNFIESVSSGESKIIITSRIGLGAYEYPVKLKGIEERYASQLLRTFAKLRNVSSLSKLEENTLRGYAKRMNYNPSYIKWFVSSVQTGLTPEGVLQNSNIFLEFCMSNVYEYLSEDAQLLTSSLQCAAGLKDIPEIAYLTGLNSLRVVKSIQELMATNMLSQVSKKRGASVKTTYELSELARAYLMKFHSASQEIQKNILTKRNKLNSLFEQQKALQSSNKYQARNIKFRDKSDRVVAKMLRDSQQLIDKGKNDDAFTMLQEAHTLAPDYFEVARFRAYLYMKNGHLSAAREQYKLAIALSPNTSQLYYWFGKFILKSEMDVDDAVTQFEKAHTLDKTSIEVSVNLARAYLFQQKFIKTQKILDELKADISDAEDHLQKMYHDTQIQIFYRQADRFSSSGDYENALCCLLTMRACFDNLENKYKDRHIRAKLSKCRPILKYMKVNHQHEVQNFQKWVNRESSLTA